MNALNELKGSEKELKANAFDARLLTPFHFL